MKSKHYLSSFENLFICGNARRGQSLIKYAIGEGKMAAVAIEDYLEHKH